MASQTWIPAPPLVAEIRTMDEDVLATVSVVMLVDIPTVVVL